VDLLTHERRSLLMGRVRQKNTSAEIRVRKVAHGLGLRFRLHRKDLPGTPDIVFPKHRIAIFVHGCFWHRHAGCPRTTTPKTRNEFWIRKFEKNLERDKKVIIDLQRAGWQVEVIWECETLKPLLLVDRIMRIFGFDP